MKFYRLYSGADGQSHFAPCMAGPPATVFDRLHAAKGLVFRNETRSYIFDWHPAPRRQWVITLAGSVEIGLGDGSSMTFGRGDSPKMSPVKAIRQNPRIGCGRSYYADGNS
ncbi:MAG: hypothetical protein Q8S00_18995 [Deltaproteobacteria bacterium]|nr:hypothetical protein [Deltaproteobacteria bacterium]MDZ4341917.1 hypothetical protein [Candidatus Binatia bacterium]